MESQMNETMNMTANDIMDMPVISMTIEEFKINEIKLFLENDLDVKHIVKYKDQPLTPKQQNTVVHRLVRYAIDIDPKGTISTAFFEQLVQAVLLVFPKEKKNVYFSRGRKGENTKKRIPTTGKLWNHYNYVRKADLSPPAEEDNIDDVSAQVENEDEPVHIEWLKNNIEPWEVVENYWKKTISTRQDILKNGISEYVSQFPCLDSDQATDLIKIDFDAVQPTANDYFEKNFDEVFQKLKNILITTKFKNNTALAQAAALKVFKEGFEAEAFALLAYLIPPSLVSNKRSHTGAKKTRKPSVKEIEEALFIHVVNQTEIDARVDERREYCKNLGLSFQPTIIFVGPSLSDIEDIVVICDRLKYFCGKSVRKAIQVCFNIIYAFHAEYPAEAKQQYTFIQLALFNIKNENEKPSIFMENLIAKF